MKPPPTTPSESKSPESAKLCFQAACIFASAVAFSVIYNSASPLGVRPQASGAGSSNLIVPHKGLVNETLSLSMESGSVAITALPRKGLVNDNLSMTLESAAVAVTPPPANDQAPALPPAEIPNLSWPQVKALLGAGRIVLVDARSKEAFDLGHIPEAVWLPSNATVRELQAFAARYPKETPLVVYCASTLCQASPILAQNLVTVAGFKNVSAMPGGFAEYTLAQASLSQAKP